MLENELDENDPLQNYVGELNGETLLAMCYSISVKNSQDVITTDRTLRNISTVNPINFYDNQHDNHLCNKSPSYPTLRYLCVSNIHLEIFFQKFFFIWKMTELASTGTQ